MKSIRGDSGAFFILTIINSCFLQFYRNSINPIKITNKIRIDLNADGLIMYLLIDNEIKIDNIETIKNLIKGCIIDTKFCYTMKYN
jgi:hypothetical protein